MHCIAWIHVIHIFILIRHIYFVHRTLYIFINIFIILHYSVWLNKSVGRCAFLVNCSLVSGWILDILLVTSIIRIYWSSEKSIYVLYVGLSIFATSYYNWILISFDLLIYYKLVFSVLLIWWNIFHCIFFLIQYKGIWSWL